jgi:hypothetical protein
MSYLCGTVAGMVTPKKSMSTEGETLQISVRPYWCSIAPFCCVFLGCSAAEFRNSGGTYKLPCIYTLYVIYKVQHSKLTLKATNIYHLGFKALHTEIALYNSQHCQISLHAFILLIFSQHQKYNK